MPGRDRPEDKLPGRPQPGGTRTDLKPGEPTKVTGPLLTADESDEGGDDDEPLFSDEAPAARPRFADSVTDDGEAAGDDDGDAADDDDDDGGFLEGRTVAEAGGIIPDGPTRVTVTPLADPSVPVERTIVSPLDLAALRDRSDPSEFDAPTTLNGEEIPGTSPTASSPLAVAPVGDDDVTTRHAVVTPATPVVEPTTVAPTPTPAPAGSLLAALPPLSPAAYMGVGFAAATVLGLLIAGIVAVIRS